MGTCPVFELSLYGDKRLVFNGKENTKVEGEKEVVLDDEQFEAFLGIIDEADWVNFKGVIQIRHDGFCQHKISVIISMGLAKKYLDMELVLSQFLI